MVRSRRGSLFVPDERGIGGAIEISETFNNFNKRLYAATPVVRS